jgi:hypothetical protein
MREGRGAQAEGERAHQHHGILWEGPRTDKLFQRQQSALGCGTFCHAGVVPGDRNQGFVLG